MQEKLINHESFFTIEDEGVIEPSVISTESIEEAATVTENQFTRVAPQYQGTTFQSGQILRIETTLSARWSGVRSCGNFDRLVSKVDQAANAWLKEKFFEHRDLNYYRYGYTYSPGRYSNRSRPWPDNSRYCNGSTSFPIYIEFVKP